MIWSVFVLLTVAADARRSSAAMLVLPLPFVVTLLLLLMLLRLAGRADDAPFDPVLLALVAVLTALSALIGLRWGYGIEAGLPLQATLAAAAGPLAWIGFRRLTVEGAGRGVAQLWPQAVPPGLVVLLILLWPDAIDAAVIAIHLAYGVALARLARAGPDALRLARLDQVGQTHRALQATAVALILSAAVGGLIALDLAWADGRHGALIVSLASLPALLMLGFAALLAGRNPAAAEPAAPVTASPGIEADEAAAPEEDDIRVVAALNDLMQSQALFRDLDLNLARLARRSGIPARRISMAVNRVEGRSISHYVNDRRIAEACRLLAETDQPVTTIMFEAGFQTKSNFNREFRRVTGTSPTAWRAARAGGASAMPVASES
ncbi:AraC family transcriptional regulator [Inquilinus sp.]|uniref:helix-turn-helix domain-containing protein n=1 Tax=Inquilinus sp. TaxID=1932117 RepID=UPI0031CEB8C6